MNNSKKLLYIAGACFGIRVLQYFIKFFSGNASFWTFVCAACFALIAIGLIINTQMFCKIGSGVLALHAAIQFVRVLIYNVSEDYGRFYYDDGLVLSYLMHFIFLALLFAMFMSKKRTKTLGIMAAGLYATFFLWKIFDAISWGDSLSFSSLISCVVQITGAALAGIAIDNGNTVYAETSKNVSSRAENNVTGRHLMKEAGKVTLCPACGTANDQTARFCGKCGAALHPSASHTYR